MSELQTSLVLDLKGNLQQRAKRWGRSIKQFSRDGQRDMTRFKRATDGAMRGLDKLGNRWTGLLSGAAAMATIRQVGNFNDRLLRLGIQANIADDKLGSLKQQILDTANAGNVRADPGQILDAIDAIVEKTGDLKFAQDNIKNIGLAMQATGASGADIGEILAEFQKMDIKAPDQVLRAIDILNVQGKEGAFTLQNLAALGPRVITAYTAAGRGGVDALREMGAALQMIRQGTGSSEMAATAFEATMRTFTDPKKIKDLKTVAGIDVYEHLANGEKVLKPINQLMAEIVRTAGGDISRIGSIFDAEAVRAFNAAAGEFNRTGELQLLDKYYQVVADGQQTQADAARGATSFAASMQTLSNAWTTFADNNLAEPVAALADAINSLDPDQLQRVLEIGKKLAVAGAGVWALNKVAKKAEGWGRSGSAGSAGGGLMGGGGGPVPVYIVGGAGGAGMGGSGAAADGKSGKKGKRGGGQKLGKAVRNAAVIGEAYLIGDAIGSVLNEAINTGLTKLNDGKETSLGTAIYDFFNGDRDAEIMRQQDEELAKALEKIREKKAAEEQAKQEVGGELKITIDNQGTPRVTGMEKRGGMDLTVDTGRAMNG